MLWNLPISKPTLFLPGKLLVLLFAVLVTIIVHCTQYTFANKEISSVDHTDEMRILRNAAQLRNGQVNEMDLHGYPPGLFYVHDLIDLGLSTFSADDVSPDVYIHQHILLLRFSSLLFSIGTSVLLVYAVRFVINNRSAELLAGLAWALSPIIVRRSFLGLTEPGQSFFIVLALFFSVLALHTSKKRYAMLSTLAGLGAVMFKYTAFPALLFGIMVPVWFWLQHEERKRAFYLLVGQFFLITMAFVWVVFIYGAFALSENPEPALFLSGDYSQYFTAFTIERNLSAATEMISVSLAVFILVSVIGSVTFGRTIRTSWQSFVWLQVFITAVFFILFLNTYLVHSVGLQRYLFPIEALVIFLFVTGLYSTLRLITEQMPFPKQFLPLIVNLFMVIGGLVWLLEPIQWNLPRLQVDARGRLVKWTETALPPGKTLFLTPAKGGLWQLFDNKYGYSGPLRPYVDNSNFIENTLEEWHKIYVYYGVLQPGEFEQLPAVYREHMLLLKTFKDGYETLAVYALYRPTYELQQSPDAPITLIGYDLNISSDSPETLTFTPYWQVQQPVAFAYQTYLHLVGEDSSEIIAQADGPPVSSEYPTNTWADADTAIPLLGATFTLEIPLVLKPGNYELILGLYNLQDGSRLQTTEGQDYLLKIPVNLTRSEP